MAPACIIDWHDSKNEVFYNPRMPAADFQWLSRALSVSPNPRGEVWIATSGSSGSLKWVVLSKSALLTSAQAVNEHLQSSATDIWLNPLPMFHVGGLGIHVRGFLSGAAVYNCPHRWNPHEFVQKLIQTEATLTSLVPAQAFDLAAAQLRPPGSLRAIIVGGGSLHEEVYLQCAQLGWKLLPSYGLTECASQVATASLLGWSADKLPLLAPLSHVSLDTDAQGFLKIKSPALLNAYANVTEDGCRFEDPKDNGWFTSEDLPVFEQSMIKSVHRQHNFIKIGGESVDFSRLEKIFEEEKLLLNITTDTIIIPLSDDRLGYSIHMVTTGHLPIIELLKDRFHLRVHPYERIRAIHHVPKIPRSPLKKILLADLVSALQNEAVTCSCPNCVS